MAPPRVRPLVALGLGLACQGGSGPLAVPTCAPGTAFNGVECAAYARRSVERIPTPWIESGRALTLELVIYQPLGAGPYPTLIFHHGSTGIGNDPTLFTQTYTSEVLAKILVDRGWQVLFPQRRGRGASDGLYDDGFEPDRSRYSCRQEHALPGLAHALEDADVIYRHVRTPHDTPGRIWAR